LFPVVSKSKVLSQQAIVVKLSQALSLGGEKPLVEEKVIATDVIV